MFMQLKVTGCLKTLDQSKNYESKLKSVNPCRHLKIQYETGTAMNARASENYLAISCSSSASKRYIGDDFFSRAESSLIQSSCRSLRNLNFRVETNILVSMSEEI
jgi:hypothetical protein